MGLIYGKRNYVNVIIGLLRSSMIWPEVIAFISAYCLMKSLNWPILTLKAPFSRLLRCWCWNALVVIREKATKTKTKTKTKIEFIISILTTVLLSQYLVKTKSLCRRKSCITFDWQAAILKMGRKYSTSSLDYLWNNSDRFSKIAISIWNEES